MLYSLSLSFLYQRDKEAVLLWIPGIIPLDPLYYLSDCQSICHLISLDIAVSEGYKTKASCMNGIESVQRNAPEASVEKAE